MYSRWTVKFLEARLAIWAATTACHHCIKNPLCRHQEIAHRHRIFLRPPRHGRVGLAVIAVTGSQPRSIASQHRSRRDRDRHVFGLRPFRYRPAQRPRGLFSSSLAQPTPAAASQPRATSVLQHSSASLRAAPASAHALQLRARSLPWLPCILQHPTVSAAHTQCPCPCRMSMCAVHRLSLSSPLCPSLCPSRCVI